MPSTSPLIGEVKMVAFDFAPRGWALCNGQLLPISQNQALFSILGTTYGGDGQTTFALPNLQGRVPVHFGSGVTLGEIQGETAHTLITSEMPAHTHLAQGSTAAAASGTPVGNTWASQTANPYGSAPDTAMHPTAIGIAGASQAHENMQPYLVINFAIALQGIFPSRN